MGMTREEQIDWLCRLRSWLVNVNMPKEWRPKFSQALTDAIKVLEQEPCEDVVSRKEAIRVMCANCPDWQTCKLYCVRKQALESDRTLPSVLIKQESCEDVVSRKEINNMKYKVCCPMCDNKKCVRGTDSCEAEQWAKSKLESEGKK